MPPQNGHSNNRAPQEADSVWSDWLNNRPHLRRQAIKLTRGNVDEADELLSMTIVNVARHMQRQRTTMREPKAFLSCALRHEFIGQCRKRKSEFERRNFDIDVHGTDADWLADDGLDPLALLGMQEAIAQLVRALETLPTAQRLLCRMRFYDECSYEDIAQKFNISEALARKRIQLLRDRLRGLVSEVHAVDRRHSTRFTERVYERL